MHSPKLPYQQPLHLHERSAAIHLLNAMRDVRFAGGLQCLHCASREVTRWGTFSNRQRYRCKSCRRTFSDLTQSPLAYTKRLGRWPAHLQLMRHSATLRQVAARAGIHLSTAFRWRHATLRGACRVGRRPLSGIIEMAEVSFAYSEKGARDHDEPRRTGAMSHGFMRWEYDRVVVLLLRGRNGQSLWALFAGGPTIPSLRACMHDSVRAPATLVCAFEMSRRYAPPARAAGHQMVRIRRAADRTVLHHLDNVHALAWRLQDWLLRFRGVATKYLGHYLEWHRLVDMDVSREWLRRCVPVSAVSEQSTGSHQQFSRTESHRCAGGGGPPP